MFKKEGLIIRYFYVRQPPDSYFIMPAHGLELFLLEVLSNFKYHNNPTLSKVKALSKKESQYA